MSAMSNGPQHFQEHDLCSVLHAYMEQNHHNVSSLSAHRASNDSSCAFSTAASNPCLPSHYPDDPKQDLHLQDSESPVETPQPLCDAQWETLTISPLQLTINASVSTTGENNYPSASYGASPLPPTHPSRNQDLGLYSDKGGLLYGLPPTSSQQEIPYSYPEGYSDAPTMGGFNHYPDATDSASSSYRYDGPGDHSRPLNPTIGDHTRHRRSSSTVLDHEDYSATVNPQNLQDHLGLYWGELTSGSPAEVNADRALWSTSPKTFGFSQTPYDQSSSAGVLPMAPPYGAHYNFSTGDTAQYQRGSVPHAQQSDINIYSHSAEHAVDYLSLNPFIPANALQAENKRPVSYHHADGAGYPHTYGGSSTSMTNSFLFLHHQQSPSPLSDKTVIPMPTKGVHQAIPVNSFPASSSDTPKRVICRWRSKGMTTICRAWVTESNLVEHLASHGIKNLASDVAVRCGVCDRVMKRESLLRHFRELHLKQRRKPSMKQGGKYVEGESEGATSLLSGLYPSCC